MNTLKRFLEMISYQENTDREGFILREYKEDQISEQADNNGPEDTETTDKPRTGRRKFVKPRRPGEKNQEGSDKKNGLSQFPPKRRRSQFLFGGKQGSDQKTISSAPQ
ncbi:MAG: hypothetical protein RQM92_05855 [Candidatus Syntrophopropionicum ammoniitolerans]